MLLSVIALLLLVFIAYMCISSFKMARESNESAEAGIVLGACFACIAFIILNCIF